MYYLILSSSQRDEKLHEDISKIEVVEKILRSLPPKLYYVVATIEESKDLST